MDALRERRASKVAGADRVALYRHYNATSGDYLLNTSSAPPSGYVMQATLGYSFTSGAGGSGVHQNLVYNYDPVGNITAITDNVFTGSRLFSYDALNRLTQGVGYFGQNQAFVSQDYIYNAIGNILQKGNVTFTYGDAQHPSAVTAISTGKTYTYDANGNMLTRGTQTIAWDLDNRVANVSILGGTTYMQYDYTGMRVKKDGPGGISLFPFKGYEIAPGGEITKFITIGVENFASKKGNNK